MTLSHLNIGTRLYIGFAFVLCMLGTLLLVAERTLDRLEQAGRQNQQSFARVDKLGDLRATVLLMQSSQRAFSLTGDAELEQQVIKAIAGVKQRSAELRAMSADSPQQLQHLDQLDAHIVQYRQQVIEPAMAQRRQFQQGWFEYDTIRTFFESGPGRMRIPHIDQLFEQIGDLEDKVLAERLRQSHSLRDFCDAVLLYGGLLTMALAALCAHWLKRNITAPLHDAVQVAQNVAAGDLSSSIAPRGNDETALLLRSLQAMNHNLSRMVREVRHSAETVTSAAGEMSLCNQDLSARTESQATALQQSVASLGQLTQTVGLNAEHARSASELAESASRVAADGGQVVDQVVATMQAIRAASGKIVDIIAVIDSIAFQTNILALNAAVEAARAGKQGLGFAVVAAEVRGLAQRSAAAAREVKHLIENSTSEVEAGSKLVLRAGQTMAQVVGSVQALTGLVGEISASSREQDLGIRQVNDAIAQIDGSTQQNATLVEQGTAAVQSLEQEAQRLVQAVSAFRTGAGTR